MTNTKLDTQATLAISENQSINFSKWMSKIPDSKTLAQISIPGTHDSGAYRSDVIAWAKTQEQNFFQQLNHGVRFFDIRGRVTDNNTIVLHHGSIYLKVTLHQFINEAKNFLKSNPSETIIMSLKEDHEAMPGATYSFPETFEKYYFGDSIFFKKGGNITLGDARGKIVLLRRFVGGKMTGGYSNFWWGDNQTFTSTTNGNITVKVQDKYDVSREKKRNAIAELLMEASRSYDSNYIHINFTSLATDIWSTPWSFARQLNPFAATEVQFYNLLCPGSKVGWVIMDFINNEWSQILYQQVINANFNYPPADKRPRLFEHINLRGKDLTYAPHSEWNDKVSSILLQPRTAIAIYEHVEPNNEESSKSRTFYNYNSSPMLINLTNHRFNDEMSAYTWWNI
ncbi:phosphatidylinositol-specific phospholipase C [Bacillus cereus]|uniref:phosphatidylinositol-specific phospholipase C n=1 Tax=Bacillus cereus TaxID=1396 RepID=UPI001FFD960D|nr:phosphatidylinositol-specific phospholipase C [Bacillus cereus]UPJ18311.1 phosphatidylinositol-specific phospholipase C [Bacillus cereus]